MNLQDLTLRTALLAEGHPAGYTPTRFLVENSKEKQPYKEKSKSKDRKKDYSDQRRKKRGEE